MMAIAHTLVAGAIAAKVGSPILAPTLALGSHFILDSIPHWDFGTNWKKRTKFATGAFAIVDTLISIALAWIIFTPITNPYILGLCIIMSLLPDWLEAPWFMFFASEKYTKPSKHATFLERFFYKVHQTTNLFHTKTTFVLGIFSQILTVALALWVLQ